MLNHPTLDQLKDLKLSGMADAFVEMQAQDQAADLGHAEWLALLLDREAANRSSASPTNMLPGRNAAPVSIIMSRWRSTTTRCQTMPSI